VKCLLSVCLIALLAAAVVHVVERPAEASQEQLLRKGVSVKMAGASNAQPMPEADNADAWIVTVAADGQVYFGVDPLTPQALEQRMIRSPRKRSQRLYIKADARVPFASVQKALEAASAAEFEAPVLLVSQRNSSKPGTMVAPEGLEVLLDGVVNSGAKSVVEVISAQGSPTLRIDDQEVPFAALHDRVHQISQKTKTILLRADARSLFGDVARVIDACRAAGVTVVVATPVV
jgi:biopolymer transport protein ExbD